MSISELTDLAIKHLYAGEVLRKVALDLSSLTEHMTDEQVAAVIRVRELILSYAQSELIVTQGLCDVAEQERNKC